MTRPSLNCRTSKLHRLVLVSRFLDTLRNSPKVYELLVHAEDLAACGHHENSVGGGFKGGGENGERGAQLLLRPFARKQGFAQPEPISKFRRYDFHGVLEHCPVAVGLPVRFLHRRHERLQLG